MDNKEVGTTNISNEENNVEVNNLENQEGVDITNNMENQTNENVIDKNNNRIKDFIINNKKKVIIISIVIIFLLIILCYAILSNKKETKVSGYKPTVVNTNTEETKIEEPKEEPVEEVKEEKNNDYYEEGNKNYKRVYDNPMVDFDFKFLQLENTANNKVYSPISIKTALKMLSDAAKGESKKQIDDVLGEYNVNVYPNDKKMSFANAMFIKNSFMKNVNNEYTSLIKKKYDAEMVFDSFETPDNINRWISEKTFNIIKEVVGDDIKQNDFLLTNALAIDLYWVNQIHNATGSVVPGKNIDITYDHEKLDDKETRSYRKFSGPYYSDDDFPRITFNGKEKVPTSEILADFNRYDIIKELGEKKIKDIVRPEYKKWLEQEKKSNSYLYQYAEKDVEKFLNKYVEELKGNYGKYDFSTDCYVLEDKDIRVFGKDLKKYNNITLQYVGIMPKNQKLEEYVKNISASDINTITKNMKSMKIENFKEGVATVVRGNIPFFKYDYDLKLQDDLQKLGIEDIFTKKADLSNLTSETEWIDKAIHKTDIEFSNDGIKAASVTAIGGLGATGGGFDYLFKIPVERIDVTFNKPFMYIIRDKDSGEVWFTGTVYTPKTTVK